jgi:mediator of RNA polymerase II transcription subunit 12, fungi type
MPPEYRMRLRALIPYLEPNLAVADLAYASTSEDASGASETSYIPVQNKPWEWTENLGELSGAETTKESNASGQQSAVRNAASLSLDLFNARVIGKRAHLSEDTVEDPRIDGALRMFQDDLLTESVFRRDFRETRVDPSVIDAKITIARNSHDHVDSVSNVTAVGGSGSEHHPSSRVGSPSGSVRSRGSMQPPSISSGSGSRRSSPATTHGSVSQHVHSALNKLAGSSAGEPIDVDMLDTNAATLVSGTKRKGLDVEDGDDDIQIVEDPVVASQVQAKKTRVKVKAKNR